MADHDAEAPAPPTRFERLRQAFILVWLAALAGAVGYYLLRPEEFSAEHIAELLRRAGGLVLVAYFVVSVLRSFVLIPSTPFVLAGGLLLPDRPLAVLAISMAAIALSATLVYHFSGALGFDAYFRRHSPQLMERMRAALAGPRGFLYLCLWAFFPLVPTDLACYLAGTMRLSFWRMLAAVCLGEVVLVTAYVGLGHELWSWLG